MLDTGLPVPQGTPLSVALTDYNAHVHSGIGLGIYVPRAVTGPDWIIGNFNADSILHQNWLSLDGIVPVGAKAVHFQLRVYSGNVGKYFQIFANQTAKAANWIQGVTIVANQYDTREGILFIDPDLLVDAYVDIGVSNLQLTVLGWFI